MALQEKLLGILSACGENSRIWDALSGNVLCLQHSTSEFSKLLEGKVFHTLKLPPKSQETPLVYFLLATASLYPILKIQQEYKDGLYAS